MTITIEDVWIGNSIEGRRDVLVTSSVKDPRDIPSGTQALNWYRDDVEPREFLKKSANLPGTKLAYYSPGVTARELLITVSIAGDHQFEPAVAKKWVEAAASVAGLPAFLGGGPQGQAIVRAAGSGLNLAIDLVDRWLDLPPSDLTWEMNINSIGEENFTGGWVLLTPDTQKVVVDNGGWFRRPEVAEVELEVDGNDYIVSSQGKLVDRRTGEAAKETWPYVLLKIDGTPDDILKKWRPMKLAADLMDRFFHADSGPLDTDVVRALQSFSDLAVVNRVSEIDRELTALRKNKKNKRGAELETLNAKQAALEDARAGAIEGIQDADLKDLYGSA
ncbi:hypothetical protein [Microbacterium sp. CPCC 204701]|uniref:hypothetical protein n=1 Tax=Microbacterium sp. CPCC 204701 TaxID=2493084 RepID=UPI000FD90290|nr:hypothetical protein [Microbacterium sp. CPCC 204701]